MGGNAEPEYHTDAKSYYRQIYYEALDYIINGIKNRSDQPDYKIYVTLEKLILKAAYQESFDDELDQVMKFYKDDFNRNSLKVQHQIFGEDCKKLDIINVRTITKLLNQMPAESRDFLHEVYVLITLILVMPATNATSERSFSLLRLIKSYLRSTMGQSRLNHLMVLNIYKEKVHNMGLEALATVFINKNDDRRFIFGQF